MHTPECLVQRVAHNEVNDGKKQRLVVGSILLRIFFLKGIMKLSLTVCLKSLKRSEYLNLQINK